MFKKKTSWEIQILAREKAGGRGRGWNLPFKKVKIDNKGDGVELHQKRDTRELTRIVGGLV